MLAGLVPRLRPGAPVHLLGIGDEDSMRRCVQLRAAACALSRADAPACRSCVPLGIDTFDSAWPTRLGRHATLLTSGGRINLRKAEHARAQRPPDPECACHVCRTYSLVRPWAERVCVERVCALSPPAHAGIPAPPLSRQRACAGIAGGAAQHGVHAARCRLAAGRHSRGPGVSVEQPKRMRYRQTYHMYARKTPHSSCARSLSSAAARFSATSPCATRLPAGAAPGSG